MKNLGNFTRNCGVLLAGMAASSVFLAPPAHAASSGMRSQDAGISLAVSLGDSYIAGEGARWFGNSLGAEGGDTVTNREDKLSIPGWMEKNPDLYSGKSRDVVFPGGTYTSKESGKTDEPGCHRSDAAEIQVAGIKHAGWTRNLACSGATTDDILTKEYRGEKPQLEQLDTLLKAADIDTVVVSIGGNDLGLSDLVEECVKKYLSGGVLGGSCGESNPLAKADGPQYASLQAKVVRVLTKVRETFTKRGKAQPRIILQGYPRPIAKKGDLRSIPNVSGRYQTLGYPFRDESVDLLQQVGKYLNDTLSKAAGQASVNYLDTTEAFQGHELGHKNSSLQVWDGATSDGRAKGKYGPESLEWTRWVDNLGVIGNEQRKRESLHPNYLGTQSEAACLASFIKQMRKTGVRYIGKCQIGKPDDAGQAGPDQTTAAVTEGR